MYTIIEDRQSFQFAVYKVMLVLLLCYLFYQELYTLQLLCTGSLVGQD